MKHSTQILIALVLLAGLSPQPAAAAVSPYVDQVLERADAGIAHAQGKDENPAFSLGIFDTLTNIATVFSTLTDTQLRVVEQHDDLLGITACLHADLLLIKDKMEDVQKNIDEAREAKKSDTVRELEAVLRFLNARYGHLLRGARDPAYRDQGWETVQSFEDKGWCCAPDEEEMGVCTEMQAEECAKANGKLSRTVAGCERYSCEAPEDAAEEAICPFHSDYLPPTLVGYGCDTDVLADIQQTTAVSAEYDALQKLLDEREAFLGGATDLNTLAEDIAAATHDTPDPAFAALPMKLPVYRTTILSAEALAASQERTHKTSYGCEGAEGDDPPPEEAESGTLPSGAAAWELRGPFSLTKNTLKILSAFWRLRRDEGAAREQADYLKLPGEFPDGDEEEQEQGFFGSIFQPLGRLFFRNQNTRQGEQEARTVARTFDAAASIREILIPLRRSVQQFGFYGLDLDRGLRGFTRNYAWFLRRSCAFRPCNERLERVLKIVFEPTCYLSLGGGDYEKCKEKVE